MAEMTPDKIAAQEEAEQRTNWERRRIEYYRGLRYNFSACDVDSWLDTLYDQQKAVCKAQKDPSRNQVRKDAGIGFWENAFAFTSKEKKKELDVKKAEVRKKLQEKVDKANAAEREYVNTYNNNLNELLQEKHNRLKLCNPDEVKEYFKFALDHNTFSEEEQQYLFNYNLECFFDYDPENKQLIIDYRLPITDQISRVREWTVNKNNEVVSKEIRQAHYFEIYERILFDLSMRTVGILFESDTDNVLNSIVFNGYCIYSESQSIPTFLISFEIPRRQYSYDRIQRMDCISKKEIARLKNIRYLDDIHSDKVPAALKDRYPTKLVVPLRSPR